MTTPINPDSVIPIHGVGPESLQESWNETISAPPAKTLFHRVSYPPRLSLNGILLGLLCTLLLVMMGFVIVPLPSPLHLQAIEPVLLRYSFQLPLALMIGAFLGPFMGAASVLLFLLIGLTAYPVFANGGGWGYLLEPGFGYLLGMLVSACFLGQSFHKAFHKRDSRHEHLSRSLKIVKLTLVAVLMLHIIGVVYWLGLSFAGQSAWLDLPGGLLRLTVETLPYDILATAVFLGLVRQLRLSLWFVLY